MFICRSCGSVFYEPKVVYESRGEFWGLPAYEAMGYCPHCESEDFDEYSDDDKKSDWEEY